MCMVPDTCDSRAESALNSAPGTGSISKSNSRARRGSGPPWCAGRGATATRPWKVGACAKTAMLALRQSHRIRERRTHGGITANSFSQRRNAVSGRHASNLLSPIPDVTSFLVLANAHNHAGEKNMTVLTGTLKWCAPAYRRLPFPDGAIVD